MIEAIDGKGVNRANVVCDECDRREPVTCDYMRSPGGQWTPNEGQVRKKITAHGWSDIKGKLRCPKCEAKRKAQPQKQEAQKVAAEEPPREPTKVQKREIMAMLEVAYDTEGERYKGGETDDTVADALNVMPGWVRELREEFFGPDGGSADMDELLAEFEKWRDMAESLTKIRKAVGPRVLRMVGQ